MVVMTHSVHPWFSWLIQCTHGSHDSFSIPMVLMTHSVHSWFSWLIQYTHSSHDSFSTPMVLMTHSVHPSFSWLIQYTHGSHDSFCTPIVLMTHPVHPSFSFVFQLMTQFVESMLDLYQRYRDHIRIIFKNNSRFLSALDKVCVWRKKAKCIKVSSESAGIEPTSFYSSCLCQSINQSKSLFIWWHN